MPDRYENYDTAKEGINFASEVAGAGSAMPNPMGAVANAQMAYHLYQYGKIRSEGMKKALANEERGKQLQREMQTPQVQASSMVYGTNGFTEENGWVKNKDGVPVRKR